MTRVAPSCGHSCTTYTWIEIAELWMCAACIASIGSLYQICSRCARMPAADAQLVDVFRVGRLCPTCRREYFAARPVSC